MDVAGPSGEHIRRKMDVAGPSGEHIRRKMDEAGPSGEPRPEKARKKEEEFSSVKVPKNFKVGDPVWIKRKRGMSLWPGKILDPPPDSKISKCKKEEYVLFFGSIDFAWVRKDSLIPHSESVLAQVKSEMNCSKACKSKMKSSKAYESGIEAIIRYSKSYKKGKFSRIKSRLENDRARVVKSAPKFKKKKKLEPKDLAFCKYISALEFPDDCPSVKARVETLRRRVIRTGKRFCRIVQHYARVYNIT